MPEQVQSALTAMARSSPREICGFILGDWTICPIRNVAKNDRDFEMDQKEQISFFTKYFNYVIGVYHSHPGGRETPSDRDIAYAPARMRYWIVTPERVIEWEIRDGVATEVSA
jgi:proteasome lid subunit RPN8/RPN11